MFSSLVTFVRPAAAVTAVVLVWGAVQAVPAVAAPSDPLYAAISISAHAVYPADDETPGSPGTDVDAPADAGPAPGSLRVSYEITNVGTDRLQFVNGYAPPLTVGQRDDSGCDPLPNEPPIAGEDFELYPGRSLHCAESISGIPEGVTLEDVLGVSAWGISTGTRASDTTRVWAEVDAPAPPPAPTPSSVGHLVYVDTNHDGQRDEGEPGIPGARLSIDGPDGRPPPGVDATQTTDEHGTYRFPDLEPGVRYTVTLDLTSLDLTNRTPTSFTRGVWEPGATTWSLSTGESADTWDSVDFGFFPKIPLVVTIVDLAPTRVVGAAYIEGRTSFADNPRVGWAGPASVEFRAGGTPTWTKLADVNASDRGNRHVWATLKRSGWLRFRSPGNRYFAAGVSREIHVVVTTAPVRLYAQAPATVPGGMPLIVTGSITRSYQPFTTGGIVLERTSDGKTWTTVANVRSSRGLLKATVQPALSGSYRYRYAGDSANSPATSPTRRVVVLDAVQKSSSPLPRR